MNIPLPKRLLSLLLCCAMLLGTLPGVSFAAYAESGTVDAAGVPVIEAEGSVEISLAPGESTTILFTPTYDSNFIVVDAMYNWICLEVYDLKGNLLSDGGNHSATFDGVTGETYLIKAINYGEEQRDGMIFVFPSANATSIALRIYGMDGPSSYSGYAGDRVYVDAYFEQLNAIRRNLVWGVSNTSVVQIVDRYDDTCVLELVGEGTATLTATNPNGLSATFVVTSKVMEPLGPGDVKSVSINPQMSEYFTFTPAETGTYTLWCEEQLEEWPHLEVLDEDGQTVSLCWLRNSFAAEQGKTYKVLVCNYSDNQWDFTLHLDEAVPADELWLDYHEEELLAGESRGVSLSMAPGNADRSNVTWSVDDPSVIELFDEKQNDCQYRAVGTGTATITVTDGNRTDSLTVTVLECTSLTENKPVSVTPEFDQDVYFAFVPQEDGVYTIGETNGFTSWMHLWGSDVDMWNYNFVQAYLRAGESYHISAKYWDIPMPEMTFCAVKAGPAEGISFREKEYVGYEGEIIDTMLSYFPFGAEMEDMEYTMEGDGGAELFDPWRVGTRLNLTQPGTFTLTATSVSNPEHTASCTVTVLESPQIGLGDTLNLTLQGGEPVIYRFIAPADGGYILWQEDSNLMAGIEMDADPNTYANGRGFIQFEATEGQQLLIRLHPDCDEPYEATFHMGTLTPVESISLWTPEDWLTGVEGQRIGARLSYFPENASRGQVQWESSDPSVAEIVGSDWTDCDILLHNAGTATITAKGKNNTSTSFTVTSYGSCGELVLDETVYLSTDHSQVLSYHFTVPEDGTYIIWDDNQNWHGVELLNSNGEQLIWKDNTVQFYASAGEAFTVIFHCYDDVPTEYAYTLSRTGTAESIALHKTSASGYPGDEVWLVVLYNPGNTLREDVTWTTSDPNIVQIMEEDPDICGVRLVNSGTATVTVETKDGLSASCEITVEETLSLEEDQPMDVHMDAWERKVFTFTPSDSGTYAFWETKGIDCWTELWGPEGLCNNTSVQGYLEAGQTYFFCADTFDQPQEMTFCVSKTVPTTSIRFYEDYTCIQGEILHAKLCYEPLNGQWEEMEYSIDGGGEILGHESQWGKLQLTEPGTFTLTATAKNNPALTASCTITVLESISLTENKPVSVTPEFDQEVYFTFVPQEDGVYTIGETNGFTSWMHLWGSDVDMWNHNFVQAYLRAGESYQISAKYWEDPMPEMTFCAVKAGTAEGIRFQQEEYTGYAGETIDAKLYYSPFGAEMEDMEYTMEGTGGAELVDPWRVGTRLNLTDPGTITLTATSKSNPALTASCTITVLESEEVHLGDTLELTLQGWEPVVYRFTAPEDGSYILWQEGELRTYLDLSGSFWSCASSNGFAQFEMEAGQTCIIRLHPNSDEPYQAVFHMSTPAAAESIYLDENAELCGAAGQRIWYGLRYNPGNALREELQWESSDPAVAEIVQTNLEYCCVMFHQAGSATITATAPNGISTSFTVTSYGSNGELVLDETETFTMESQGSASYTFTVPEDGTYIIWDGNYNWGRIGILDSNGEWLFEDHNAAQFQAYADQTYTVIFRCYNEGQTEYAYTLSKTVEAEGISLHETRLTVFPGEDVWLNVIYTPGNALRKDVTWTSTDPSVIEPIYPGTDNCGFRVGKPGTATVTLTTADGLTASCEIIVRDYQQLHAGETLNITIPLEDTVGFAFSPTESGTYYLWFEEAMCPYLELYDSNNNYLGYASQLRMEIPAAAGAVYYIRAYNYAPLQDFTLHLEEETTATGLSVNSRGYIYAGLGARLTATTIPGNGSHGPLEWKSGNPEIMEVQNYDPAADTCLFKAKAPGEVTITVRDTELGLEASHTITVRPILSLELGTTVAVDQPEPMAYALMSFTPETDGTYVLKADTDGCVSTWVYAAETYEDQQHHLFSKEDPAFTLELKGGVTYWIDSMLLDSQQITTTGSYSLRMTLPAISGTCGENLTWELEDGVLTISGTGDMDNYSYPSHVAPWAEKPESITSVVIKEGVTSIGDYAFWHCRSLTSLTLPEGVTSLGQYAISGCSSLTSLTLPSSLTSIGNGVFFATVDLSTVTVPETNADFRTIDGVLFSKDCTTLLFVPRTQSGSYIVPETVASIGEYAFAWCDDLTGITLPKGLTSIDIVAFECCNSLKSITIPEGVTSIPFAAFNFCINLTSITIPASVTSIGDGAFRSCDSLTTVYYGGTPEQWKQIVIDSENECLTNAAIVYADPSARMKLSLPMGATTVEEAAFQDCVTLESVLIPANVKSIGTLAFDGCTGLTAITFSGSAPTIAADAFAGVTATVYYPAYDPSWTVAIMANYGGTLTWVPYAGK